MLTLIDRNGAPGALTCPAFLCDYCKEPVYAKNGLAVWEPVTYGEDNRPNSFKIWTVHKGLCDRALEASAGGSLRSRELGEFVEQLLHNVENPFTEEPGVEYIAPAPSTWRLGKYER